MRRFSVVVLLALCLAASGAAAQDADSAQAADPPFVEDATGAVDAGAEPDAASDTARATPARAEPGMRGLLWLVLSVLVAVIALGGAFFLWQRRRPKPLDTRHSTPPPPDFRSAPLFDPLAPTPPTVGDPPGLVERVTRLEAVVNRQGEQLATLLARPVGPPAEPPRLDPAPSPVPAATLRPPAAMTPVSQQIAEVFADWCRQGSPMVNRVEMFRNTLSGAVPGATLRAVYRDLNAQAEPIRFDDSGGASPVEFWVVEVGQDRLLFPHPQSPAQFRDRTGVFFGDEVAPSALRRIEPARVREEGGAYFLVAPGRIA